MSENPFPKSFLCHKIFFQNLFYVTKSFFKIFSMSQNPFPKSFLCHKIFSMSQKSFFKIFSMSQNLFSKPFLCHKIFFQNLFYVTKPFSNSFLCHTIFFQNIFSQSIKFNKLLNTTYNQHQEIINQSGHFQIIQKVNIISEAL